MNYSLHRTVDWIPDDIYVVVIPYLQLRTARTDTISSLCNGLKYIYKPIF
jgi:hypothetical protein